MKKCLEKIIDCLLQLFMQMIGVVRRRWAQNEERTKQALLRVSGAIHDSKSYDEMVSACNSGNYILAKECADSLREVAIDFLLNAATPSERTANTTLWNHVKEFSDLIERMNKAGNRDDDLQCLLFHFDSMRDHIRDMVYHGMKLRLRIGNTTTDLSKWNARYGALNAA